MAGSGGEGVWWGVGRPTTICSAPCSPGSEAQERGDLAGPGAWEAAGGTASPHTAELNAHESGQDPSASLIGRPRRSAPSTPATSASREGLLYRRADCRVRADHRLGKPGKATDRSPSLRVGAADISAWHQAERGGREPLNRARVKA